MKVNLTIIALSLVITVTGYGQNTTPTESANLQEAEQLQLQTNELFKQKKFTDALPLAKRIVKIREKILPDNDASLALAYSNLGHLFRLLNNHKEAEDYLRKALFIEEKRLGKLHPEQYELLTALGIICNERTKIEDTGLFFLQALTVKEKQLGKNHSGLIDPLLNLAQFYDGSWQSSKSSPLLIRSIEIYEKNYGVLKSDGKDNLSSCSAFISQEKRIISTSTFVKREQFPDIVIGKVIKFAPVSFSEIAKTQRVQGVVILTINIDEIGNVTDAKYFCGPKILVPASKESVVKWKFEPSLINGKPAVVEIKKAFSFTLN